MTPDQWIAVVGIGVPIVVAGIVGGAKIVKARKREARESVERAQYREEDVSLRGTANKNLEKIETAIQKASVVVEPHLDIRLKIEYSVQPESGESMPYLVAEISAPLAAAEVRDVYLDIPSHEPVRPGWATLPMQAFDPGANTNCSLPQHWTLTVYFARRLADPKNSALGSIVPPADYYGAPWGLVEEARGVVVRCLGMKPQESIANAALHELKAWVRKYRSQGDPRLRGKKPGTGAFRSGGGVRPFDH